jgi:hypothetical protein
MLPGVRRILSINLARRLMPPPFVASWAEWNLMDSLRLRSFRVASVGIRRLLEVQRKDNVAHDPLAVTVEHRTGKLSRPVNPAQGIAGVQSNKLTVDG